ncbi:GNAT family N-acetyltransferase [Polymorphobacter sp. PAMC 29334]|uniref:GNAT family N-acetyltransferase n=1 Tax=Polymorphobacter sp. PAMC 29334 TaxID=2862331 RepID=UPI001C676BFB|nr:GNAT family N-acetyltransferase [Polymorphobacter sp. PAMC 29334]QYE36969.1 GNAT family N-acetyltransferase [Polymorphobacter sp. PAMC 29334]
MFTHRLATEADLDTLRGLMLAAIETNQRGFLTPAQVAASHSLMGLDTQLVADRTYFIVECDGRIAGCGGWSYRAGVYGGDHSTALRNATPLDPATDPARIRAMYTHPDFVRRGVGRLILEVCEAAARAAGFRHVVLMGTLSGEPLYRASGYAVAEHRADTVGDVEVPLIRMTKRLD